MAARTHVTSSLIAVAVLALSVGCGHEAPRVGKGVNLAGGPANVENAGQSPGRFDALSISIRLDSRHISSGRTLGGRLVVVNDSRRTVVDPSCVIAEGRYALVPADDPDAELWVRPMTDCAGPHPMPPGFREESRGPDFPAHTKFGEPLPPGEYLAVLEIEGLSHRLSYPVTVE